MKNILITLSILLTALHTAEAASKKTNIVVIPFDDHGCGDNGQFGSMNDKTYYEF